MAETDRIPRVTKHIGQARPNQKARFLAGVFQLKHAVLFCTQYCGGASNGTATVRESGFTLRNPPSRFSSQAPNTRNPLESAFAIQFADATQFRIVIEQHRQ
jgi:hypothetical protein